MSIPVSVTGFLTDRSRSAAVGRVVVTYRAAFGDPPLIEHLAPVLIWRIDPWLRTAPAPLP